jgi:Eukaryotic membrane protein family
LVPDIIVVMFAELVVDWVKHAFITKFNELQPEVKLKTLFYDVLKPGNVCFSV